MTQADKICWSIKHLCQIAHGHTPDEREPCCIGCEDNIKAVRGIAKAAEFGKAVFRHMDDRDALFGSEFGDDLNNIAVKLGLMTYEEYDPVRHGEICECEDGDMVYIIGPEMLTWRHSDGE